MANVRLIFDSTEESGLNTSIECFVNSKNKMVLDISHLNDLGFEKRMVALDRPTAIRLVKNMRKAIQLMEGGKNG